MADAEEPLSLEQTTLFLRAVLYELVRWSIRTSVPVSEIKSWIGHPVSNVFLGKVIEDGVSSGHFVRNRDSELSLTSYGIEYVESSMGLNHGVHSVIADIIRSKAAQVNSAKKTAPTADGFVSLGHNSEPYKQAVSSLDEVVKEFRDDKTKDNELGQEKAVLLRMLEAGREYLNDTKVRVQTVVSSIVEPLRIIAANYHEALVGALAGTALNLLFVLLGIL